MRSTWRTRLSENLRLAPAPRRWSPYTGLRTMGKPWNTEQFIPGGGAIPANPALFLDGVCPQTKLIIYLLLAQIGTRNGKLPLYLRLLMLQYLSDFTILSGRERCGRYPQTFERNEEKLVRRYGFDSEHFSCLHILLYVCNFLLSPCQICIGVRCRSWSLISESEFYTFAWIFRMHNFTHCVAVAVDYILYYYTNHNSNLSVITELSCDSCTLCVPKTQQSVHLLCFNNLLAVIN